MFACQTYFVLTGFVFVLTGFAGLGFAGFAGLVFVGFAGLVFVVLTSAAGGVSGAADHVPALPAQRPPVFAIQSRTTCADCFGVSSA